MAKSLSTQRSILKAFLIAAALTAATGAATGSHTAAAQSLRPAITAQNANQLALLNPLPVTEVNTMTWLPGSHSVLLAGTFGIWQVDAAAPDKVQHYFPFGDAGALAVSSDGKLLAAGTGEDIAIIDLGTGQETGRLSDHIGNIIDLAFRPNSHQLAVRGSLNRTSNAIKVQDIQTAGVIGVATVSSDVQNASLEWDQSGTILALGDYLFNFTGDRLLASTAVSLPDIPGQYFLSSALSPDGKFLVTIHSSLGTELWDLASGQPVTLSTDDVQAVAVSPDSTTVALLTSGKVVWWDVASGKVTRSQAIKVTVGQIRFSPDGQWLYSAEARFDGLWWLAASSTTAPTVVTGNPEITDFVVLPDGSLFSVGGPNAPQQLWDSQKMTVSQQFSDFPATAIIASPDGKWLAAYSDQISASDDSIRLFDLTRHSILPKRLTQEYTSNISFDGDDSLVSLANTGIIRRWNLKTFQVAPLLSLSKTGYSSAQLLSSATVLLTQPGATGSGPDNSTPGPSKLSLLGIPAGKTQADLGTIPNEIKAAALSPDKRSLAVGDSAGVTLYDTQTGAVLMTLADDIPAHETEDIGDYGVAGRAIAFSPDGKLLATGDRTVYLWDLATGAKLAIALPQLTPVVQIAFSPDSNLLITNNGMLRFYGVQ